MLEPQPLDIPFVIPLPWPMFDADGQLLVPRGDVIYSPEEVDLLCTLHRSHRRPDSMSTSVSAFASMQFPNTVFPDMGDSLGSECTVTVELLDLRPDNVLTVRPTAGAGRTKGIVRVVGYNPRHHLLITTPIDSDRTAMPARGELVDAHAFSDEGITTFECTVITASHIPFGYVMLLPPQRIRNRALYKSLRVCANVIGKMLVNDDPSCIIYISDISAMGASFHSAHRLEVGSTPTCLCFRVKTRDYHSELVTTVLIHSEKPVDLPDVYQYGVEFIELVAIRKMPLQYFIYEQLLWGGQRMM